MILLFPATCLAVSDISEARYYGTIRASNNGTAVQYVSAPVSINSTALINSGLINSSANNTAIRDSAGDDIAFMPGYDENPWIIWVDNITESGTSDAILYTNSSNGSIRYFPAAAGMTVPDDDSLEPSDNFSIETTGWVDTSAGDNKTLISKPSAFRTYISDNGEITSEILSVIEQTDNSAVGDVVHSGRRGGQRIDDFPQGTINQVSFYLRKYNSPTGTANITVRAVSDDSIIGILGTLDVSTLTTSYVWHDFTDDVEISAYQNIRVQIEYAGGDASNNVGYLILTEDAVNGYYTHYDGSYHDEETKEAVFKLYYTPTYLEPAIATGIEIGKHTINTTVDNDFMKFYIDSEDETNPTNIYDESGNHNHGTITGATWSDGYSTDDALDFGDSTDHYTVSLNSSITLSANTTFEIWFKVNSMSPTKNGFMRASAGSQYNNYIQAYSNSSIRTSDSSGNLIYHSFAISLDTWYYLALINNGTNWLTYRNGSSSDTDAYVDNITLQVLGLCRDYYLDGYIEQIKISDVARTEEEIIANWNSGDGRPFPLDEDTSYLWHMNREIYLDGLNIPRNDNDWVFFENGAMPYVESLSIDIDGSPVSAWQWEYGDTFHDSISDNDATPSFRTTSSDADVSAELISFSPLEQAEVSEDAALEWPEMMEDAPDTPETAFTEETHPGIFFEPLVDTIWGLSGLPTSIFWYNFAFIIILAAGIFTFYFFAKNNTQGLLIKCIVMAAIMVFFALPGPNIYGMYIVLYFALWCFGIIVLSKSWGW